MDVCQWMRPFDRTQKEYVYHMSISLDIFPGEREPRQMSGTVGRVGNRLIGCGARKNRIDQGDEHFHIEI